MDTKIFDHLINELDQLTRLIEETKPMCWANGSQRPLQEVQQAISDYWYQDGRDGRETTSYYAAVSAQESVLAQVHLVNQIKTELAAIVSQLRKKGANDLSEFKGKISVLALRHLEIETAQSEGKRDALLNRILADEGLARIHLKQLTRKIPVLKMTPEKLAFNWYQSGRSIQKISKQDAIKRLGQLNPNARHIQLQYQALAEIADSTPLAIVQELAPIMRLNVLFPNKTRQAMNIAMPVFFENTGPFPAVIPPKENMPEKRMRQRRSDNQLEDVPFLPSLRVYRYQ